MCCDLLALYINSFFLHSDYTREAQKELKELAKAPAELSPPPLEDPDSPSNLESSWGPVRTTRSTPSQDTTAAPPAQAPIAQTNPRPVRTAPPAPPKTVRMSTPPRRTVASHGTPNRREMYTSIQDAIDKTDHYRLVDFDFPPQGHGTMFQRFKDTIQVSGELATVKDDEIKITLESIVDLRDFHDSYSGQLVLNGRGFVLTKPWVCKLLVENADLVYALEDVKTEEEALAITNKYQQHVRFANKVKKDASLRTQTIFFEFPEGVVCTTNMTEEYPDAPSRDMRVPLRLRELPAAFQLPGKDGGLVDTMQMFNPAFFTLRVVRPDDDDVFHLEVNEEQTFDVCSAMQGMKQRTNKNIYQI